jgi:hypothetical protein
MNQTPLTQEQPITLSALREKLPQFHDEVVEGIGTFRLHRLPSIHMLRHSAAMGEITDDNGDASQDELIDTMLGFVAKSLGGEFDTPDGLATLQTIGVNAQLQLIAATSKLNGLSVEKRMTQLDEAKNG